MIVELYRFSIGPETFLYAAAQQPVTYQSETYEPTPIARDRIRGTEELARAPIKIRMPRDAEFAARWQPRPPTRVAEVRVFQIDDAAPAPAIVYVGRVLDVANKGSQAIADCEPLITSLKSSGLRRHYQYRCPHALYDHNCRVPRVDYRVTATITAIDGFSLTAAEFADKPDGWFQGGDIEYGSPAERRSIIAHTGDTITLSAPLADIATGDELFAYAGCDHVPEVCRDRFNNFINYGGTPWIPLGKNPYGSNPVF